MILLGIDTATLRRARPGLRDRWRMGRLAVRRRYFGQLGDLHLGGELGRHGAWHAALGLLYQTRCLIGISAGEWVPRWNSHRCLGSERHRVRGAAQTWAGPIGGMLWRAGVVAVQIADPRIQGRIRVRASPARTTLTGELSGLHL